MVVYTWAVNFKMGKIKQSKALRNKNYPSISQFLQKKKSSFLKDKVNEHLENVGLVGDSSKKAEISIETGRIVQFEQNENVDQVEKGPDKNSDVQLNQIGNIDEANGQEGKTDKNSETDIKKYEELEKRLQISELNLKIAKKLLKKNK